MRKDEHLTQRRSGATNFDPRKRFASSLAPLRRGVSILVFALTLAGCTSKPSGPLAYVTNERDGTITVIDTATDTVYSTIKIGGRYMSRLAGETVLR